MSEQKTEEKIEPANKNVSDEYYKGYRAGYNKGYDRALKKVKKSNLEISVQKEVPIKKEAVNETAKEIKEPEIVRPQPNSRITMITAIIIAIILGGIIWYVVSRRNRESNE